MTHNVYNVQLNLEFLAKKSIHIAISSCFGTKIIMNFHYCKSAQNSKFFCVILLLGRENCLHFRKTESFKTNFRNWREIRIFVLKAVVRLRFCYFGSKIVMHFGKTLEFQSKTLKIAGNSNFYHMVVF